MCTCLNPCQQTCVEFLKQNCRFVGLILFNRYMILKKNKQNNKIGYHYTTFTFWNKWRNMLETCLRTANPIDFEIVE